MKADVNDWLYTLMIYIVLTNSEFIKRFKQYYIVVELEYPSGDLMIVL